MGSNSLKATLVAEHSRKTHQDPREHRKHDESVEDLLLHVHEHIRERPMDHDLHMYTSSFAAKSSQGRRAYASENPLDEEMGAANYNRFSKVSFDENYKTHSLCESWNSGHQSSDLEWSESADRLLRIIGNGVVQDGYNMFMAPGQGNGKTTNVSVAVYIESMSSFKAQTMDFEVDMYLAMGWYDRRLAHNCTHPILVTHKFIADRIWQPDLYFVNSKFAYLQEVTTPNFMMIVYPDGLIFKSMRIDVTLSCMMSLQRFPMDKQECPLVIQSYAYVENLVNLSWHDDPPYFPIGSNTEIKLNDMIITGNRFEKCSGPYPMFRGTGNWSCIRALIVMKRLVLFHVIQTYIPTAMLVSISWMSFWLDPRASPARISLTITSLLTLTTMSNGARQDLPQVSYIKALDIWLTFSQALIFLVLLEYSFVSYYMTKRNMECEHRKPSDESASKDDIRLKRGNYEETVPFARLRTESPILGLSSIEVLRRRHSSLENNKVMLTGQNSNAYSVTTGLAQCANNAAVLYRLAAGSRTYPCPSLADSEAETTAMMTAAAHSTPYAAEDLSKPCGKCQIDDERIARQIDQFSRCIFPTVFSGFVIAYWLYYGWYTRDD
uniref:Uncharacterized protein n=1 Tax=Acrobeloides nanus TaxID=290746 RepID=A0A914E850_9BILA